MGSAVVWRRGNTLCSFAVEIEGIDMTVGSATISALVAAVLATLLWWIGKRLALPEWACILLFGVGLALVILAGPLIRLP